MRPLHAEVAAIVSVAVEIRYRVLVQLRRMRLDPFRRAEQSRLLPIPRRIDDRALRPPPLLPELAERASFFQFGDETRDRILRAVDPGVVVIAANHPLIGLARAGELGDHIVERL